MSFVGLINLKAFRLQLSIWGFPDSTEYVRESVPCSLSINRNKKSRRLAWEAPCSIQCLSCIQQSMETTQNAVRNNEAIFLTLQMHQRRSNQRLQLNSNVRPHMDLRFSWTWVMVKFDCRTTLIHLLRTLSKSGANNSVERHGIKTKYYGNHSCRSWSFTTGTV